MAAFDNFDLAGVVESGTAVITEGCDLGKRREYVDLGHCESGLPDAAGFAGNGGAQFGEETALDFNDFFLGVKNFRLVLF